MIAWLLKNWKILLDLILVVGGIILLAVIDPFGMFSKAKLKSTANLVSSVRDIGELVTAEYYGEVISSLHETIIYNRQTQELSADYESFYYSLKELIVDESLIDEDKKFRKVIKNLPGKIERSQEFKDLKLSFAKNSNYQQVFAFLGWKMQGGDWDRYIKTSKLQNDTILTVTLKKNTIKVVLEKLVEEYVHFLKNEKTSIQLLDSEQIQKFIYETSESYLEEFPSFHYRIVSELRLKKRKTRKQDIVFIGRGWVKAGFRFGQLDASNFYYDESNKIIHFYGLNPVVLDKDINPWFIPEQKIKGFELIDYYGDASFEEAKLVKMKCKQKLLEQAEKASILHQARQNGEVALQSFFSLVLDEPDLKVSIKPFPNESMVKWMMADTLITVNEALKIDSIFQKLEGDDQRPQVEIYQARNEFRLMMNKLMTCDFVQEGTPFSFFSLSIAKHLEKKLFLQQSDYAQLKRVRNILRDTLYVLDGKDKKSLTSSFVSKGWYYENYNSFTKDFNEMMRLLDKELKTVQALRNDTLLIEKDRYEAYELGLGDQILEKMDAGKGDTIYSLKPASDTLNFWDLHYPIMKMKTWDFDALTLSDTSKVDSIFGVYSIETLKNSSQDQDIQTLLEQEVNLLGRFKADSVKDAIKRRPVQSFVREAKKLFSN